MPATRRPVARAPAAARRGPKSLKDLNAIIAASEPLVPGATQAVLGEGPADARIAFVGELVAVPAGADLVERDDHV